MDNYGLSKVLWDTAHMVGENYAIFTLINTAELRQEKRRNGNKKKRAAMHTGRIFLYFFFPVKSRVIWFQIQFSYIYHPFQLQIGQCGLNVVILSEFFPACFKKEFILQSYFSGNKTALILFLLSNTMVAAFLISSILTAETMSL